MWRGTQQEAAALTSDEWNGGAEAGKRGNVKKSFCSVGDGLRDVAGGIFCLS